MKAKRVRKAKSVLKATLRPRPPKLDPAVLTKLVSMIDSERTHSRTLLALAQQMERAARDAIAKFAQVNDKLDRTGVERDAALRELVKIRRELNEKAREERDAVPVSIPSEPYTGFGGYGT